MATNPQPVRIPTVSVLLPVYNAARHLSETLASLAAQTQRDFEIVAVDDGSTDGSSHVLAAFAQRDERLRIVHQKRAGIAVALNRAIAESRGRFLARMDADDVAAPDRLTVQAELLLGRPEVAVCGSWVRVLNQGRTRVLRLPSTDDAIRARLLFGSAFVHPAVMIRRESLANMEGPYEPAAPPVEDYRLWLGLADQGAFFNIPRVLLTYRQHAGQVTAEADPSGTIKLQTLRRELLSRIGVACAAREQQLHEYLAVVGTDDTRNVSSREIAGWLRRLRLAVPTTGWCSSRAITQECSDAWWRFMRGRRGTLAAVWDYCRGPVMLGTPRTLLRMARLALPR